MMRSSRHARWLLLQLVLSGCGLREVELAPNAQNEIVIGDVARSAIDKLRSAGSPRKDPARLSFVYPSDGSALPENLAAVTFQWQVAAMAAPAAKAPPKAAKDPMQPKMQEGDAGLAKSPPASGPGPTPAMDHTPVAVTCELRVRSPESEVRLYTHAAEALLPDARWRALLRESTGHALTIELRALFASTNEVYLAAPLQIEVRGPVPAGALYFWSTTAQGVLRARVDEAAAVFVAPRAPAPDGAAPKCGGCHAVARDGRRLLLGRGTPARLATYSLPDVAEMLPVTDTSASAYGWGAFDPTASRIAVSSAGVLRVLDADTGQALAKAELGAGVGVSHPDWSPDGRYIALTLLPDDAVADDENVTGTSIARIRVALDGSLAAPELLVAAMGKDDTLSFPTYSPDGAWLAFERAKGASKEAKEASLWLVAADGGEAIELKRAATTSKGKPHAIDTMPTWMPGERADTPWLLFSSTRDYGNHMLAEAQDQLFVSAIDTGLAARGEDPSKPALWLPSQELGSSNHRALFGADVAACVASLERCDGRDQDCDGKVDEDCCTSVEERCGDGVDNDCDGSSDEGCGCLFKELCDDGVDDDCDGKVDEDCEPMPSMPPMPPG
jgi:hypothetical protein